MSNVGTLPAASPGDGWWYFSAAAPSGTTTAVEAEAASVAEGSDATIGAAARVLHSSCVVQARRKVVSSERAHTAKPIGSLCSPRKSLKGGTCTGREATALALWRLPMPASELDGRREAPNQQLPVGVSPLALDPVAALALESPLLPSCDRSSSPSVGSPGALCPEGPSGGQPAGRGGWSWDQPGSGTTWSLVLRIGGSGTHPEALQGEPTMAKFGCACRRRCWGGEQHGDRLAEGCKRW